MTGDTKHYKTTMRQTVWCFALAACFAVVAGHTYHLGTCPNVDPEPNFQMNRFLGIWYVQQKTSTASKCIIYNFTRGEEPGEYVITQDSDNPLLGLLKQEYHYTGELSVPEPSIPGRMQVRFPLNVAGSASFVVFMTDYDNYAGIYTCQKLPFANRQSATILSRHRNPNKKYIDELRQRLSSFGVNPFELSIISQDDCLQTNSSVDINPNTFSAENLGNVVRKAGEKLGDGVQWIANTGSKVYHKIAGSDEKPSTAEAPSSSPTIPPNIRTSAGRYEVNEVEWIP